MFLFFFSIFQLHLTFNENINFIYNFFKLNLCFRFRVAAVYSNDDNKSGPISKPFLLNRGPPNRSLIPPTMVSAKAVNTTSILLEWEVCII